MTRTAKGTVYRRGQKLWIGFKAPDGRWTYSATGLPVGKEAEARRVLELVKIRARSLPRLRPSELTVGGYFERWIESRRAEGIRSVDDEATRISKHALPVLGHLRLTEVESSHVRDLLVQLKRRVGPGRHELAPRTVRHVYNTLKSLFFAAEEEGLVAANPCTFRRKTGLLPKKRDKDPLWRKTAFFEPHEVRAFLEDARIPEDRRVLYALAFFTGMRFGELSALTWGAYQATMKPLGRLLVGYSYDTKSHGVKEVKTENPRDVPVHPRLAALLADWRAHGWQQMLGREPNEEDLLIPSREAKNRTTSQALKRFYEDSDRLALRRRRFHDTRRTFRTICLARGAQERFLDWITHGPPEHSDVRGGYFSATWPSLCSTVLLFALEDAGEAPLALPPSPSAPETADELLLQSVLRSTAQAAKLEEFRGLQAKNSDGGGGNRTRVRKPSALRPYVRSPRFEVGSVPGTDALPPTPSR
jgi:integrase